MAYEKVYEFFEENGMEKKVLSFEESSATVLEAANALGCEPKQIAKTMSFLVDEKPILIVTAGDAKIDNAKFKEQFHQKAKMIPREDVEALVGHAPGGVCPFAISSEVKVYLDVSLKRFEKVYPAAGNANSAVELTIPELWKYSNALEWVDCSKDWM